MGWRSKIDAEPELSQSFNPTTTIEFTVPAEGKATLRIYDVLGREVAILFRGEAEAGRYHQATFDAKESDERTVLLGIGVWRNAFDKGNADAQVTDLISDHELFMPRKKELEPN